MVGGGWWGGGIHTRGESGLNLPIYTIQCLLKQVLCINSFKCVIIVGPKMGQALDRLLYRQSWLAC